MHLIKLALLFLLINGMAQLITQANTPFASGTNPLSKYAVMETVEEETKAASSECTMWPPFCWTLRTASGIGAVADTVMDTAITAVKVAWMIAAPTFGGRDISGTTTVETIARWSVFTINGILAIMAALELYQVYKNKKSSQ